MHIAPSALGVHASARKRTRVALPIDIAGRYTLENVADAHAAYEERRIVGKPVLDIDK